MWMSRRVFSAAWAALVLPQKPLAEPACDFIIRMIREHPHQLTLVTLGRMTNLALALEKARNI